MSDHHIDAHWDEAVPKSDDTKSTVVSVDTSQYKREIFYMQYLCVIRLRLDLPCGR